MSQHYALHCPGSEIPVACPRHFQIYVATDRQPALAESTPTSVLSTQRVDPQKPHLLISAFAIAIAARLLAPLYVFSHTFEPPPQSPSRPLMTRYPAPSIPDITLVTSWT